MWPLPPPAHTARETYIACISRVQDDDLRARLIDATQAVLDASQEFEAAAEQLRLHTIPREAVVGGCVTAQEMGVVYNQRMARKGAPGRPIYDAIIGAPVNDRCPLCGGRLVTTLDHCLPKMSYPALAVTPLNLVPSCSDCNKTKLIAVPRTAADVTLHPYFDNVDGEQWLQAEVVHSQPAAMVFRVNPPDEWTQLTQMRVQNHFRLFGLAKLYAALSAEELLHVRHQLSQLHDAGGMALVRSQLQERAGSCRQVLQNGWRTATYEAWSASNWFCSGGFLPPG